MSVFQCGLILTNDTQQDTDNKDKLHEDSYVAVNTKPPTTMVVIA